MPAYAGPSTAARTGDVAGTLRLMAYLSLSLALVVLDHRGGWLSQARKQAAALVQPLWMVAGWPGRLAERLYEDAGTLGSLTEENRRLRSQALVNHARMARMQTLVADNARLRGLLDAAQRGRLDVQLAPILDIDLDPTRQRLVLDAGSNDGVRIGQSVIDAGGLLGQIIELTPMHSNVLLLTDPDHAVPVVIARNGVRLVAYGQGRSDLLALASIPLSSDVKVGDAIVTSGLGGRFPPGFPVGTITALRPDESRAFLLGDVKPAAQLDRGRDVLLLRSMPPPAPPVEVPVGGVAAPGTANAAGAPISSSSVPNVALSSPSPAGRGVGVRVRRSDVAANRVTPTPDSRSDLQSPRSAEPSHPQSASSGASALRAPSPDRRRNQQATPPSTPPTEPRR
ncbi:rod shape-determining protein MreC [Lysobacter koreensis]|uniref:Cell shape-determining protein MreC n=1 Tax=Lysobacter koreensis TaxID=266122 RepID=A0ABW2YKW3_9GAMM